MMNKGKLPHIITAVLFVVFVVLGLASATAPGFSQYWSLGELTDQWGATTGKHFMSYNEKIRGVYSTRLVNNEPLIVEEITFSNEYLSFDLLERGGTTMLSLGMSSSSLEVTVTMVTKSLGEKTFSGGIASDSAKTIIVDFNEDLLNVFKLQEVINFRITISSRTGEKYYQFNFTPVKFIDAYDRMNSL